MANIKTLTLYFNYSPLPNPSPSAFMSQFNSWQNLERLAIVMLSFMGGGHDDDSVSSASLAPNSNSKLKELIIRGNLIPTHSMVSAFRALQVPLETLHLIGIALLGPGGILEGLRIVGHRLKTLGIHDDGRISAIGSFTEEGGLLFQLAEVVPKLEQLELSSVDIPQRMFSYLPSGLRKLVIKEEGTMSAKEVQEGIENALGLRKAALTGVKQMEWIPSKKRVESGGWSHEEIEKLKAFGTSRGIDIVTGRDETGDDDADD
jgi:hypothetical protein